MEKSIDIDKIRPLTLNVGHARHNADWNWKDVYSPFARMYYVTEGRARVIIDKETIELSNGKMYFIPAFTRHSYECEGIFEHYYIHIYEDARNHYSLLEDFSLPTELDGSEMDLILFRRLCKINPTMQLSQSNPRSYDNPQTLMLNVAFNKQRSLDKRMESRGILLLLMSRFVSRAIPESRAEDERIWLCTSYIRRHIYKAISISELSGIAGVSKDHLIRLFKKECGMTPVKYINTKKIERAQLLLATEEIAIKEVGYLLGFGDISYFNRIFRRVTGMSPTQFRQGYIKE